MNQEIANFFVKFTTEGLSDVKKGMEDINKNIEGLKDSFEKGQSKGDSFFGALVKWTGLVGGLTAAFAVLRNTIKGVFDVAYEVVDLYKQEQLLGVSAGVLEKYGLIAKRNMGNTADASAFFKDVKSLMSRYQLGKVTDEDNYLLNMLGVNWSYDRRLSAPQNRDAYIYALHNAAKTIDPNDEAKMELFAKLVGQESMRTFLMANDEQFQKQLAWGDKWRVLSKNEDSLANAQKAITVETEWEQTLKEFRVAALPILTKVLTALEPVIDMIRVHILPKFEKWVDENKDKIGDWVTRGVEWLLNDLPDILEKIWDALKAIGAALLPIVQWIGEKLLGTISWFSDAWDVMFKKDGMTSEQFMKKYGGDSKKGGYAGMLFRGMEGLVNLMATPVSQLGNTTNNINQGNTVVVEAGYHDRTVIRPNAESMGALSAHYAMAGR